MDWDDAYANGAHIPDAARYPPRWAGLAAQVRADLGTRAWLDLPYGDAPRSRLDLFLPEGVPRGLAVFVHGGYWRAFGKNDWSHLAAGPLARGWAVAMPGYTLCPKVRISAITVQIGQAISHGAGLVEGPIHLSGHSAGGHLVTRMVCQHSPLPSAIRARIGRVVSISGVHDLRPLLRTQLNTDLGLDETEAAAESPALLVPRTDAPVICWAGSAERPEFRRQNALLANIWTGFGVPIRAHEDPGRHHFDVIDGLMNPAHPLTEALVGDL